ncbi:hypothetical protein BH10PLA1_BH10PLA1_22690 [soil metagenome]
MTSAETIADPLPIDPAVRSYRRDLLWAHLVLIAVVLLVGWRTFHFDFVRWDDDRSLYENPHIQSFNADNLRWMFSDITFNRVYMPLGWLLYAISYQALGLNPQAHHVYDVSLHLINAVLVFAILRWLAWFVFRRSADRLTIIASLLAAAAWAVHPLRVEVFAWTSARVHSQACVLLFAAVLFYFAAARRAIESARPMSRTPAYWIAVLLYAISVFVFPTGVALAPALFVLDVFVLRDPAAKLPWRKIGVLLLEKLPFLAIAAASTWISVTGRAETDYMAAMPTLSSFGVAPRFMQACYVWMVYLGNTFYPHDLSPLYLRLTDAERFSGLFWLCAALCTAITIGLFFARGRFPAWAWAWLIHLLILLPFVGLTERIIYTCDRYSYADGVIIAAVLMAIIIWAGARLHTGGRAVVFIVAGLLVAGLGAMSIAQESIWENSEKLFTYMAAHVGPGKYQNDLLVRLGSEYIERGRPDEAVAAFDRSLAGDPQNPRTLAFKGRALLASAMKRNPGAPLDAAGRATCMQAAHCFDQAAQIHLAPEPLAESGVAYLYARQWKLAAARLQYARRLAPNSSQVALKLAEALYCGGDTAGAQQLLDQLAATEPSLAAMRQTLIDRWEAERTQK